MISLTPGPLPMTKIHTVRLALHSLPRPFTPPQLSLSSSTLQNLNLTLQYNTEYVINPMHKHESVFALEVRKQATSQLG